MEMKKTNAGPLVVDQETAAGMLGVDASTLRRWHREGRGPPRIRIGRLVRYRPKGLERFLKVLESAESVKNRQPLPYRSADIEAFLEPQMIPAWAERRQPRSGVRTV